MPYPDNQSRKLVEEIKTAFAESPQNDLPHRLRGSWCDECSSAQEWLSGKHWRQFLRKHTEDANNLEMDMCVLNAHSWHFFLPALLIQNIKNDSRETFHLDPTPAPHRRLIYMEEAQWLMREDRSRQLRIERFSLLRKRQCQAVQHYIQYLADRSEAKSLETEKTLKYPERFAATQMRHKEKYTALLEFWQKQEQAAAA